MSIKRSLGKGLAELGLNELLSTTHGNKVSSDTLITMAIDKLVPGKYQPRQVMEPQALEELAASIRMQGIIQPIVVRRLNDKQYEIVAGERRWRAAQLAGLEAIPCIIVTCDDEKALQVALVENLNRQDLNPIEKAKAIARFIAEFSYTHEQAATCLGKPRTEITNWLRLLKLDDKIQDWIAMGKLSEAHGKILAALPSNQQCHYADKVLAHGWAVRDLERALKGRNAESKRTVLDPNIVALERTVAEHLGFPVSLEVATKRGRKSGFLKIRFSSLDELDGILERIGYKALVNDF